MIDLDELERLARKATKSPWYADEGHVFAGKDTPTFDERTHVADTCEQGGYTTQNVRDGAYIAALSPDVALELIRMARERG